MLSAATSEARPGFIHIPKNAGTSVRDAIERHRLPIAVADHWYVQPAGHEEIAVLRCPLARFVSAFRYGKQYWPSPVNARFDSASELAESAGDPGHPKHAWACVEMGNRPEDFLARNGKPVPVHRVAGQALAHCWVYAPQSAWLGNQPRHLLRASHLSADFDALLAVLDCEPVALPALNASGGDERLSPAARDFIEQMYLDDYQFIRSRGLDDCLT
jgi:hypothetical protein